jgi:hypothetical protein
LPGTPIIPRNYGQSPGIFTVNLRINKTFGFGALPGANRAAADGQQPVGGQTAAGSGTAGRRGGGGGGGRPAVGVAQAAAAVVEDPGGHLAVAESSVEEGAAVRNRNVIT